MKLELVDSRVFKVPKGRIRKWAEDVGLPKNTDFSVTQRAETSVSDDADAADADDDSDANTFNSGECFEYRNFIWIPVDFITNFVS